MRERILIVDDDHNLRALLELGLTRLGYDAATAPDGVTALASFQGQAPHLAIVDVMMPHMDGWRLTEELRRISDLPILVLTAKASDLDKARGLDLGADDFMTKPFSFIELEARVRALLRRRGPLDRLDAPPIVVGPLALDPGRHAVTVSGREVSVTPTEFRILVALARSANRVVSMDELLLQVWGPEFEGQRESIKPYISKIRRKLSLPSSGPGAIHSTYGVGYMLCA